MPVVYTAAGALTGALTTADVTPPNPAHAGGDILICITAHRVITETCATPSGWTLLFGPVDETAWRSYVFWKRADGAAETNPLCDWTSVTGGDKYGQVHGIRGAIGFGSPFADSQWTDGAADPAVCTGVTTVAANQFVCALGLDADNLASAATTTSTDPASYSQRTFNTTSVGADAGGFFFDALRATAGATGNISVDFNGVPLHWGVLTAVVIRDPVPPPLVVARWGSAR